MLRLQEKSEKNLSNFAMSQLTGMGLYRLLISDIVSSAEIG